MRGVLVRIVTNLRVGVVVKSFFRWISKIVTNSIFLKNYFLVQI
jgi:hypothetical protein